MADARTFPGLRQGLSGLQGFATSGFVSMVSISTIGAAGFLLLAALLGCCPVMADRIIPVKGLRWSPGKR